jgi:lipopolysaccharide/colanic/teichoic acid biosynthesis glycosyltransferase
MDNLSNKIHILEKVNYVNNSFFYLFTKRTLDIVLSILGLLVFFIPMIIVSGLVVRDKGTVFFKQKRLGLNGKEFTLIKFRTMVVDAEKNGMKWAEKDDPRITKIGKLLRKHRIDELPQLINILLGQMSIVGPRPEVAFFYEKFEKYIVGFNQRLLVKPGLTGWAQVNGGYNLNPEEKIVFDLEYIKKQNIFFDLKIILKTILVVINKEGAH